MTTNELRKHFNETFDLKYWPKTFPVDHKTYANVCQELLSKLKILAPRSFESLVEVSIWVGPSGGIMFKDVELILKGD